MDSKHFKRYSTLLVIKNESCLQVETKMRYHLTAVWMAINRNVVQVVQKIKPCALLVGNANWCSCYEIQYGSSSKMVKIELPHDPAFPHLTIHWKKKKLFQKVICRILWVVQCLRLGAAIADWICVQFLVREGPHAVWYRGKKLACTPMLKVEFLKSIT